MTTTTTTTITTVEAAAVQEASAVVASGQDQPEILEQDLLVEDVSIDGMCGVY